VILIGLNKKNKKENLKYRNNYNKNLDALTNKCKQMRLKYKTDSFRLIKLGY
jgi:hypothetical protein